MEKFADVLDLAQAHTECEVQWRVAAILRHVQQGCSREFCIDCSDLIPASRRQHVPNATRCATCQSDHERSHALPARRCAA